MVNCQSCVCALNFTMHEIRRLGTTWKSFGHVLHQGTLPFLYFVLFTLVKSNADDTRLLRNQTTHLYIDDSGLISPSTTGTLQFCASWSSSGLSNHSSIVVYSWKALWSKSCFKRLDLLEVHAWVRSYVITNRLFWPKPFKINHNIAM